MTSYKESGVDVEAGEQLVDHIKQSVGFKDTFPNVIGGIGGFAGMYRIPPHINNPVMISCTDGVGTKLRTAIELDHFDGIGTDLVAMCVNDLICTGGEALFFQDYYATSILDVKIAKRIIDSIVHGCAMANIPLLGGETAEMPGVYKYGEIDLAGFAGGVVSESRIVNSRWIESGDVIVGFESSGFHSNGYSLLNYELPTSFMRSYKDVLLEPTRLYNDLTPGLNTYARGYAHITGGGLQSNIDRMVPDGMEARLRDHFWGYPDGMDDVFLVLGGRYKEFATIFNMGIGFAVVCRPDVVDRVLAVARARQHKGHVIGEVRAK